MPETRIAADDVHGRGDEEHGGVVGDGEQQARQRGPDEVPNASIVLVETFAAVSASRLGASAGRSADVRGPVDGGRDAHQAREDEDHDRAVHRATRRRPSPASMHRAQDLDDGEDPLPANPVGDRGDERRGDGCRDHPNHGDEADRRRPTDAERVDREADQVEPLGRDRGRPGALEAPERGAPGDLPHGTQRGLETNPDPAHAAEYAVAARLGRARFAFGRIEPLEFGDGRAARSDPRPRGRTPQAPDPARRAGAPRAVDLEPGRRADPPSGRRR